MECSKCAKVAGGQHCSKCGTYKSLTDQQLIWMQEHESADSEWWGSFKKKLHQSRFKRFWDRLKFVFTGFPEKGEGISYMMLRRIDYNETEVNQAFGKGARAMNDRQLLLREVAHLKGLRS